MFRIIHLTTLLKDKSNQYYIFISIIISLIYALTGLILYTTYKIKNNNKLRMTWAIEIIRFFLPIISMGFFGQIFLFLTTTFDHQNGYSLYYPLSIIAMILHIIISFITNSLYYKSIFIISNSDVLKKTNCFADLSLFMMKIFIIILIIIDKQKNTSRWEILLLLVVITGFNAYINLNYQNKLNVILLLLNIIFSLIVFNGFFCLFIGYTFTYLDFNGSIYLFFVGIICIFVFILFLKKKEINYVLINYKNINNPNEYIIYILNYYRIISSQNNSRNYSMILKSYISTVEYDCTNANCPLKLYLRQMNKGSNCQYLLYQYLDKLFKYGISKFKNSMLLKINYSMFLLVKMNNKKKSLIVLNTINNEIASFIINYNVHLCKKLINKWSLDENTLYYNYRSNSNELKENIDKACQLYYEFWSLLYDSKFHHSINFKKLYEKGSEILKLNKKIDENYELIIKSKTNNSEIYHLYTNFIENILKDEEKYQNSQNIKTSIFSDCFSVDEKNYSNFSMDIFKQNDLTRYILISARKKNFGEIIDCSTNACSMFGYTKEELIGMHLNTLIPDIFHFRHNELLSNLAKDKNIILFETLFQKTEYKPSLVERNFFGLLKSKFIKLLKLKIYYLKTEENIVGFLVEILQDIPYMRELLKNTSSNNCNIEKSCCILTNENLLINSFTPNCLEELGLSYRFVKASNSILPYIKQLDEDYLSAINDLNTKKNIVHSNINFEMLSEEDSSKLSEIRNNSDNNINYEIKKKIKKDLINKKYNKKCQITWRINLNKMIKYDDFNNESLCTRISHRGSRYTFNQKTNVNKFETELLMEIKKASIDNHLIGYYFYFSKLYPIDVKNFMSYSINAKNEYDKNGELKQITKYKTIIKPLQAKKKRKNVRISSPINRNYINNNKIDIKDNSKISNSYISKRNKIKEELINKNSLFPNIKEINNKNQFLEGISSNKENSSRINSNQNSNEEIIDEEYIPKCNNNFSFDINNMCYNFEIDNNNTNLLNNYLKKEAEKKMKQYKEYLYSLKQKEEEEEEEESEDDYTSESNENFNSSYLDRETSSINKKSSRQFIKNLKTLNKSLSHKDRKSTKIEKVSSIKISPTLNIIKEEKNNSGKSSNKTNNKLKSRYSRKNIFFLQTKKTQENNYYKVNLNNIHFMIFDFNKDMIVEGNKNEINFKIENIINNAKKKDIIINVGKDEKYPLISLQNNKIEKKNKKINNNKIVNEITNKINEEKSFAKKISDAINNRKEEKPIKKLKLYTLIFSFIIIILAIIILMINYYFYNQIKELSLIFKSIIFYKYSQTFSTYCVREEVLLNFNFPNINGGYYTNIPAYNRSKYKNLIKEKLVQYFIENQECLRQILSSSYSFSKDTLKNFTQTVIILENFPTFLGVVYSDVISSLIQYNSALYNLASCITPLTQNHPEIFNYMHNGHNAYISAIMIVINNLKSEFKLLKKRIFILFISSIIIILLIFIIFIFLMVLSYISSVKMRINYMEVFYGINLDSIKNFVSNCEVLINEFKKNGIKSNEKDIDIDSENKDKKSIIQNTQSEINNRGKALINLENKNNSIISIKDKIYIIFYIVLMLIVYIFFPFLVNCLYKVCNKSIKNSNFSIYLNNFHSNILELFNAYREFIFDNKTDIQYMKASDFLNFKIGIAYTHIPREIKTLTNFINSFKDKELKQFFGRDLCSFYFTDYFNTPEECKVKYSYLIQYNFEIVSLYFFQLLRNIINTLKYKLETELIVGELGMYEVDKWKTWGEDYPEGQKVIFRLDLFNNDTLHSEMNILFVNILWPFLDDLRKQILNSLKIEGDEYYFILYFCFIIGLTFVVNFLFVLLRAQYLNISIYKTKNLLLLIPMKILASQGNIKNLLNLN